MTLAARLLTLNLSSSSCSSSTLSKGSPSVKSLTLVKRISCRSGETKSKGVAKATQSVALPATDVKTETSGAGLDIPTLLRVAGAALTTIYRPFFNVTRRMTWKLIAEMLIEKGIVDCRFFTLFAVAGSLLGSVLCFVEGFFLTIESYLSYFQTLSKGPDEGHVVHLLIEAIDMFLVGSAMLVFGIGVYVMFVGARNLKGKNGGLFCGSNFFGLFPLKVIPAWVEMQTVSQAKTNIGHSILMILQVGVLEKFKSVPLVTALDLACFAAAVVVSSACIFLLSKLSVDGNEAGH